MLGLTVAITNCAGSASGPTCPDGISREQCLFEHAANPSPSTDRPGGPTPHESADPSTPAVPTEPGWDRVDEILRDGVDYMQGGSGAVDTITERWCASPPTPQSSEAGTVWVCAIERAPRLRGHELTLEFDRHALFSVTGFGYSRAEGSELVRASLQRWADWCQTRSFDELESLGVEEFHRCALSDGPTLVVGTFARDLDADLWQVSLAIIGPG